MVAIIYEFNGKQYVSATTYIKLEQENKKLNDKYNGLWKIYAEDVNKRVEENKKLKEELKKDDREVQVDVDKELLKANDYLIKENKKLKEENEKLKGQVKEPYLLFIKTIWMTENKSGFYIFRNVKDNNYELRLFNLAGAYSLSQTFDTIEGAVEYAEHIKPKD